MPLRPVLYNRLKYLFKHVVIANEDEQMIANTVTKNGKPTLNVQEPGEYFRINCPFCHDTRKRLWINHMWGYQAPEMRKQSRLFRYQLWLAVCYNENCLADPSKRQLLYDEVFSELAKDGDIVESRRGPRNSATLTWPGELRPLTQLADDNPANLYLRQRNFDPAELTAMYKLSTCVSAVEDRYEMCVGRIVIPVFHNDKPVGWQARYVGTPPSKSIPKYWTMPGFKTSHYLYNYDAAKKFDYGVVCEGPTDVWRFGPEAVCLFGKKLSSDHVRLLSNWHTVVVLLDSTPDVDEDGDVQAALDRMKYAAMSTRTVSIRLPVGTDPGDMPREYLRDYVFDKMRQLGVH